MNSTLTYRQSSGPEFDPDHPLDYLLRNLGFVDLLRKLSFDSGAQFLKCLLWALLESL